MTDHATLIPSIDSTTPAYALGWEAIQDFYATYANIVAFRDGLKSFCSYSRDNYLIAMTGTKTQAYYDESQFAACSKAGLSDFLSLKWRKTFLFKSQAALEHAKAFTAKYHFVSPLPKPELFAAVKHGTLILDELFAVFCACLPQYSAGIDAARLFKRQQNSYRAIAYNGLKRYAH